MNDQDRPLLDRLAKFGFDPDLQQQWQQDIAAGRLTKAGNVIADPLAAPPAGAIDEMPAPGSAEHHELVQLGRTAIARGQFGVCILNGGMATRFGGVVKGVVPALNDRSFLALAIDDARLAGERAGGRVPVFLMNSFATDEATKEHCAAHGNFGLADGDLEHFTQFVALRMTAAGELFRRANGELSPYGPGHGDFADAFRQSGCLGRFTASGGRYVLVRNVDNLGARVDEAVLGHHINSNRDITAEQTSKHAGDVGGGPFVLRNRLQLIEQFRYPPDFDPSVVDVFNTNTLTCSTASLDRPFDLGWYYVEKKVDGLPAVQIEHLIGELTAHLETSYLRVSRAGATSRFLPIKAPDDLERAKAQIAAIYQQPN